MSSPLDRFTVLQRLGAGGMAEVFKCKQTGLGGFEKLVVLKRILPHLLSEQAFVEMFLDEARIAANLSHQNIVQTFELTADAQGVPYIVMEFVSGPSMAQLIRAAQTSNQLDHRHMARLIEGAARGLHHAHHASDTEGRPLHIIHRDISPQNILVTLDGVAKVADFGVAKAEGRLTHTKSGIVKGKVRFTAPELLVDPDHCVDPRTDVFSLGVCLYVATTGQTPFSGSTDLKVMEAINLGTYRPPSELVPDYPKGLERVVLWLLEHDPQRRCPSALAAADALREWLTQTAGSTDAELGPWVKTLSTAPTEAPPPPPSDALRVSSMQLATSQLPLVEAELAVSEIDIVVSNLTTMTTRSNRRWGVFAFAFAVLLGLGAMGLGWSQVVEERRRQAERSSFLAEAERELAQGHFGRTEELVRRVAAMPEPTQTDELHLTRLESDLRVSRSLAAARAAIAAGDLEAASTLLQTVMSLEANDERAVALAKELREVEAARALAARTAAVDAGGPVSVEVEAARGTGEANGARPLAARTTAGDAIGEVDGAHTSSGDAIVDGGSSRVSSRRSRVPQGPVTTSATPEAAAPAVEAVATPVSSTPPAELFEPPPVAKPHNPVGVQRQRHAGSSTLHITATVRAQVFVDGLPVGYTPLELTNVGTSTHLVMVWAEGFESITERVPVAAEEAVTLQFPLRAVAP